MILKKFNLERENKNILIATLLVFIFFLIIGILVPYTGDDWNNLIGHNGNLIVMLKNTIENYNTFEGRFFSRLAVFILNYYKPLWIVINALGMAFLYYFICKIAKVKKMFFLLLIIDSLLLIDKETFSQIYVWITGNVTYFIPFIFIIFIIYMYREIFEDSQFKKNYNIISIVIMSILSFIFSMFVENVSVGIITTYLLIIIYSYLKTKKLDYRLLFPLIFSILGLFFMLNSPGTSRRIDDMGDFSNLSLFSKLLITFPRQINYVFIKNSFLVFLLVFISNYIIKNNFKGLKKYLLILYMSIIPIITLLINEFHNLYAKYQNSLYFLLDYNRWYIVLYWVSFLIIFIYLIIKYHKNSQLKLLFFFLIALINNAAMLISPLAGGRTSFLSTIMLYICVIIILNDLDIKIFNNKKFIKFNLFVCILISLVFLSYYIFFNYLYNKRTDYINEQLKQQKKEIDVPILPEFYVWNANAWDSWHLITFKRYYHIPDDVDVNLIHKN